MNKIIPFTKEIYFKTMIKEITSISLDHTINVQRNNTISGEFIVSGTYKMTEASALEEEFNYSIPINIEIDDKYETSNCKVLIDDFNYEIVNEERLKVHIDLLIDNLEEIIKEEFSLDPEVIKKHLDKSNLEVELNKEESNINIEDKSLELVRDDKNNAIKEEVNIMDIFNSINNNQKETYSTYSVYFFKEDDTIDRIVEKYNVTKEELANYNKLDEVKAGTKVIIPCHKLDEKS